MKQKSIKIRFSILDWKDLISILPTIDLFIDDKSININWLIFEMAIYW